MRYAKNLNPLSLTLTSSNNRSYGRINCRGIPCPIGEILDLSGTGMRLRLAKRVKLVEGELVPFDLATAEGMQKIKMRVKWVRKTGLREVQAGLEIEEASEAARKTLSELVRAIVASGMLESEFARKGRAA